MNFDIFRNKQPELKNLQEKEGSSQNQTSIMNNKWARRVVLAATLASGASFSNELPAQTADKSDSASQVTKPDSGANKQNNFEIKGEMIKQKFLKLFNMIGDYSDKYSDSNFMKKWNPDKFSVNYFNENFYIPKKDDQGGYDGTGAEKYDISFTKSKSNLKNFDIVKSNDGVKTWVRYNELSSPDVIALRFSLKEQPGFQKMTAHEFESTYKILETSGGGGKDKNSYYVWVDSNLNQDQVIDQTLSNFNDQSIYPDYYEKVFGPKNE